MEDLDRQRFAQAVEHALAEVSDSRRWQTAIERAVEMIWTDTCMHWTEGRLLIFSDSGRLYEVSRDTCRNQQGLCPAFANGHPCKHRAAYRIVELYNQLSQ